MIMPNYNGAKYLDKALGGFAVQDHPDKRLIVVDGKSTDASHAILSAFSGQRPDVVWSTTPDRGISDAINIGAEMVGDDAVCGYLGSDDILRKGALSAVSDLFEEYPFIDAVYCRSYFYDGGSLVRLHVPLPTFSKKMLRRHGTIAGLQNFFVRASILKRLKMDTELKYAMDLDFYFRMIAAGHPRILASPVISTLNMGDGSISTSQRAASSRERHRVTISHCGYHPKTVLRYAWASARLMAKG
ncbi:glycosyltransferase [Hoeflea sp. BAL378]|uniref:glycosyltransferase n=1 Tax=Hoeflea sp. BAL378 TaxID=1547437 RepID=UPI0013765445|nr:glycosyltransferase [Hoeflea sp. BAL378]